MKKNQFIPESGKSNRRRFLGDVLKGVGLTVLGGGLTKIGLAQTTPMQRSGGGGSSSSSSSSGAQQPFGFIIHGGVGTLARSAMTPDLERQYRAILSQALAAGYNILNKNGSGLDAVEAAIRLMEDSPLFNAGKGAVFTAAGTNELDASIMDGSNLKAGAVSVLKRIKNPISLARMVMERSRHVMMVGEGAETFARQQGVPFVPQSYFYTERRWKQYLEDKAAEQKERRTKAGVRDQDFVTTGSRFGTVGAAALDKKGNLAAGTSTGGLSYKKFGRVGDSPIIGAGTYANNETCAVSATGDGEYFIRVGVARDISALMEYGGKSLQEAAQIAIGKVGKLGGEGGVVGIDKNGNLMHFYNTEGMYRGRVGADGKTIVEIYNN